MTIQSIVSMAKTGELQNLSIKDNVQAVLNFINLGMLELHKRFPLLVEECIIELHTDKTIYTLPEDLMWIVSAYDEVKDLNVENAQAEIPINEEDNPISINTISWNKIQVPLTLDGAYISIIYVAAPATVNYAEEETVVNGVTISAGSYWVYDVTYDGVTGLPIKNDDGIVQKTTPKVITNLDIPAQMVEALLHYVGYRAHGALDGNIQAENSTHYQRFEQSCSRIEQRGMFTNDDLNMKPRYDNGVWA